MIALMTRTDLSASTVESSTRFPLSGLAALGTAGFVTIMTEALPAGVLPGMSHDLGVSGSAAGQTVTIYAIGSALAAVPLTSATLGWPRRHLLLVAIAGFAFANTVTAISTDYFWTMLSRFVAGVVAGLLWALLAGYARRMVPAEQRGKAMAVAMVGTPVALAIGVPAGTFLAEILGWRYTFGLMSILSVVLVVWVMRSVPAFPGQERDAGVPVRRTLRLPGVVPVLFVTLTFVLAHNVLYTYIAPFLTRIDMRDDVDAVLLVFGAASLISIAITGVLIDRRLRPLMIVSCALFAGACFCLGVVGETVWLVFVGATVWGLAFGGAATLLQTASAEAAGAAGDVAQSLVVTCWNIGIAGGAILGGLLLESSDAGSLPWAAFALVVAALVTTSAARRHGFRSPLRK